MAPPPNRLVNSGGCFGQIVAVAGAVPIKRLKEKARQLNKFIEAAKEHCTWVVIIADAIM